MVTCDCCGKGCLEIKCPYIISQTVEIKSMPYLINGCLSNNHQYYYQLQTQLLVSGAKYGDFVIWSPNEACYIERIRCNNEVFNEILAKTKWFFYESILPELLGRHFSNMEITTLEETEIIPTTYKYCTCKQNTGGKMLMCTQDGCPNLWYHYSCLGIKRKPSTKKWKCAFC